MATTEPRMEYFGEKWDAPVTDDADQIDAPVGEKCMSCREPVAEGDQGLRYPTGYVSHKECGLRSALGGIGHHVNHALYCHGSLGPDAGLSYRESAKLVWEWHVNGKRFTPQDLDALREEQ